MGRFATEGKLAGSGKKITKENTEHESSVDLRSLGKLPCVEETHYTDGR